MTTVTLIVPSETYRATAFLQAASRLGLDLVIVSDTEQALSSLMGYHFLQVPLDDPKRAAQEIVALAHTVAIDAVVAVDDGGLLTAALASEQLGLTHNAPDAIRLTRDKAAMREVASKFGVSQPRFAVARDDGQEIGSVVGELAEQIGFPVVVKPTGLSASRGVIRADDREQAEHAGRWSRRIAIEAGQDPDTPLVVEEFVEGDEVALEGRLRDGHLETLAIFDKPDPLNGPYFEESIYVTPSLLPLATQSQVEETVQSACTAMGLFYGPVHGEVRIQSVPGDLPRVVFIEAAARTIGGRCGKALRFKNDMTVEEIVLSDAIGQQREVVPEPGASGVMMLPIKQAGELIEVTGQDDVRAIDNIDGLEITVPPHRHLRRFPESDRYLGFVFAHADSPGEVVAALRKAEAALQVRVGVDGSANEHI